MNNVTALTAIYAPYAAPAGVIIPDDVQDFIRARMMGGAEEAAAAEKRRAARRDAAIKGSIAGGEAKRRQGLENRRRLIPQAAELRAKGWGAVRIAEALGVSKATAQRVIKEIGA